MREGINFSNQLKSSFLLLFIPLGHTPIEAV